MSIANRTVKVLEIVKELQIAAGSNENTIHKHSHMLKVSSCWVPQNLSLRVTIDIGLYGAAKPL